MVSKYINNLLQFNIKNEIGVVNFLIGQKTALCRGVLRESAHARQSLHFQKIPGGLNINIVL